MGKIEAGRSILTLINVFTVEPEHQQDVVDSLTKVTQDIMSALPGYVSANVHKSLDGQRVINYAQWRSRADFDAMFRNPTVQAHMKEVGQFATHVDPHLYEVAFVDDAPQEV